MNDRQKINVNNRNQFCQYVAKCLPTVTNEIANIYLDSLVFKERPPTKELRTQEKDSDQQRSSRASGMLNDSTESDVSSTKNILLSKSKTNTSSVRTTNQKRNKSTVIKTTIRLVRRKNSEICPRGKSVAASSNTKPISSSEVPIITTKLSNNQKSFSETGVPPFDGGK